MAVAGVCRDGLLVLVRTLKDVMRRVLRVALDLARPSARHLPHASQLRFSLMPQAGSAQNILTVDKPNGSVS